MHLLWWPNGENHQSNMILIITYICIYIYDIILSYNISNFYPLTLFGFDWPHDQGPCAQNQPLHMWIYSGSQMGKLARVAFLHVPDHFGHFLCFRVFLLVCLFFCYVTPLEWHICDICQSNRINVTPVSDICSDIYFNKMYRVWWYESLYHWMAAHNL